MELIGRQFGHIRVTEVIGEGGMGAVYAGYDEKLDRKVALKVLHADQRLDDEARERLLREARALSKVDHPNICRIHDYIETGEVDLLVLEYIDGRTLDQALGEKLPHSEKLRIAITIAEVLLRAHRVGIVHRDLKPDNVMLTHAGEVKVLDFGLARWLRDARRAAIVERRPLRAPAAETPAGPADQTVKLDLPHPWITPGGRSPRPDLATAMGVTLGTPFYMSPEQARGESLTPASDMFAFGLLLQIMFSGTQPHPENLPSRDVIQRVARGETQPATGAPNGILPLINALKSFAPADRPTAADAVARLHWLIQRPQRVARRSAIAAVVTLALLGLWRYTVDLKAERAEAQRQRARAEDLINFMLGDLRKKLEPVGRLDVLDDVGEKALQYTAELRPEVMSAEELARNATALNQLGEVRIGQGKAPAAADLFRRSLKLSELAIRKAPGDPKALFVYAQSRYWIGNALYTDGDVKGSLAEMREYLRVANRLVEIEPGNRDYQREVAYGHGNVATMLENLGQPREALPHHRLNLAVKEKLHDGSDGSHAEIAVGCNKVAVALYRLGDLRPALEYLQREHDIYARLTARDPKNMRWKQKFATNLAYTALIVQMTGDREKAAELYEKELAIERELAAHDPANVVWVRNVAMASRNVAEAKARKGDMASAHALYGEARKGIAEAIRLAPTRTAYVRDAAVVDAEYGRLLSEHGDATGGLRFIRQAVARLQRLAEPAYLARALFYEAEILRNHEQNAAATRYRTAERALEPVIAKSTDPSELALWTRILIRRERHADAQAMLARLRGNGQATAELEQMCRDAGCRTF